MEFRLIYEGPLNSNGKPSQKQMIRRKLHPQLRHLWEVDPHLCQWIHPPPNILPRTEEIADNHRAGEFRFVPLITPNLGLVCSLDILFLRHDTPGKILHRGDIDNRIKTLFDALRTPTTWQEANNEIPGEDENPFFVLMSDDALVADLRVETDRLLEPTQATGHELGNVKLIIRVKTRIVDYRNAFIDMGFQ